MVNDTLSDLLTRIRNGCLNNSQSVSIPLTRLSQQVCHTLEREGFIDSVQRDPVLNDSLIVKLKYKEQSKNEKASYSLQNSESSKIISSDFQNQKESLRSKRNESRVQKNRSLSSTNDRIRHSSQTLSKKRPCITNLKRISKPGLRVYARHKQIPTVLGGLGILILSTPKGIMTDREARFRKVGGEILCSIW